MNKKNNDGLTCDQCHLNYDIYCEPRYLPCNKTICNACEFKIIRNIDRINKHFQCYICSKNHDWSKENGLPTDKQVYSLIICELIEKTKSLICIEFEYNLNKTKSLMTWLEYFKISCIDILKEHCMEQKRLVQFVTEIKKQEITQLEIHDIIDVSNEELIDLIDDYEKQCIKIFSKNEAGLSASFSKLVKQVNGFLNEKQAYLRQINTDDIKMKKFNSKSLEFQSKLTIEIKKLNNVIFDNNKIEFHANQTDDSDLGYLDYDTCYTHILSASDDFTLKLWNIESTECIQTFKGHTNKVTSIKKTSGYKIISGCWDGTIKIWNLHTGECIKTINAAHLDQIKSILILSHDKFATCAYDKTVKIFDSNTFECLHTLTGNKYPNISNMDKLSKDKIATTCYDNKIRVFDVNSGECCNIIDTHFNVLHYIKIISDQIAAISSNSCINVFNMKTGICLNTLKGHYYFINCIVKLSTSQIASCDSGGVIFIWNIYDGRRLSQCYENTYRNITYDLYKKINFKCYYLAKLSKNVIASCPEDKTIKIWNTESGKCLKSLQGHSEYVNYIDLF